MKFTFVSWAVIYPASCVKAFMGQTSSDTVNNLPSVGGPNENRRRVSDLHAATILKEPTMKIQPCLRNDIEIIEKRVKNGNSVPDMTTLGTLNVPSIGIGTISWSSDNLFTLENKHLQPIVDTACTSNVGFFDTAERYGSHLKTAIGMGWGETESLTRMMLHRALDSKNTCVPPIVATKFTPSPWRRTSRSVVEACEKSRERLGVNQIDLYQLHMPDIVQPLRFMGKERVKDELYWDGLAECYHRGLVKNVGVCNYGPTLVTKCQDALAKRGVPLASNQIAYSLIGRHNGAQATVDRCNALGIKVLGFYPFAMGLLTGKYSDNGENVKGENALFGSLHASQKTKLEREDLNKYVKGDGVLIPDGGISPLIDVMKVIAKRRGKSVSQIALNYIICKGVIPIPGANTEAQVVDNIGALGWRLSRTEVDLLETTADSLGFGFEGAGFKRVSEKFVGYGTEKWRLD